MPPNLLANKAGTVSLEPFIKPKLTSSRRNRRSARNLQKLNDVMLLDDDSLCHVFSFLDERTLGFDLPLVNKYVKERSEDEHIWKDICERRGWERAKPHNLTFREVYLSMMKEKVYEQAEILHLNSLPPLPHPACGIGSARFNYIKLPTSKQYVVHKNQLPENWISHPSSVTTADPNKL